MEAIIFSIGRGKNILRSLYQIKTGVNFDELPKDELPDFDEMADDMIQQKFIKDYYIADGEVYFKFYDKDLDIVAGIMGAKTSGAGIRPFSNKNLPKKKYEIPTDKMQEYRAITSVVYMSDLLILSRITNRFITDIVRKKSKVKDINADMKLKMIKGKDYIHYMGYFDDYLKYLKKNIDIYLNDKNKENN